MINLIIFILVSNFKTYVVKIIQGSDKTTCDPGKVITMGDIQILLPTISDADSVELLMNQSEVIY